MKTHCFDVRIIAQPIGQTYCKLHVGELGFAICAERGETLLAGDVSTGIILPVMQG